MQLVLRPHSFNILGAAHRHWPRYLILPQIFIRFFVYALMTAFYLHLDFEITFRRFWRN